MKELIAGLEGQLRKDFVKRMTKRMKRKPSQAEVDDKIADMPGGALLPVDVSHGKRRGRDAERVLSQSVNGLLALGRRSEQHESCQYDTNRCRRPIKQIDVADAALSPFRPAGRLAQPHSSLAPP